MNPWLLVAALLLAAATGAGGIKIGMAMERTGWQQKEIARADKIIVKQETLIREVPNIVTRYVERKVVVEKEVERVVEVIRKEIPPDCVLPPRYAGVLIAFARTANGTPTEPHDADGTYDCAALLEATTKDLAAGYSNTSKGIGLQEYVKLITKDKP